VSQNNGFSFEGFSSPNGTIVPDEVFDVLMPQLSNCELRVMLYIVRRTFGFKKDSDDISLSQMAVGIRTRDGRILDRGTGLSKSSVARGVNGLVEKRIVEKTRNQCTKKGDQATTYRLRFKAETDAAPVSHQRQPPCPTNGTPRVPPTDTQQRVKQETVNKKEYSKEVSPEVSENDRKIISSVIEDFAREMNDQAPLSSSVTRALNLYRRTDLDVESFTGMLYMARRTTQSYTGVIRQGQPGQRQKMAYFFSVLGDLSEQDVEPVVGSV